MPSGNALCTEIATSLADQIDPCYPVGRIQLQGVLENLHDLVCWDEKRAYLSAPSGQALSADLAVKILWTVELDDTGELHATGTSDIVLPANGFYALSFSAAITTLNQYDTLTAYLYSGARGQLAISTFSGVQVGQPVHASVAWTGKLAAGDVISAYVRYRNGSSPIVSNTLGSGNVFFAELIQPTG